MEKVKSGNYPCPVCQREKRVDQNALSVRYEGEKILLHCHKRNCEFQEIAENLGLLEGEKPRCCTSSQMSFDKFRFALKIWEEAHTLAETRAQAYLEARGILPPYPPCLRFHTNLYHAPSKCEFPALIGCFANGSILRIYLAPMGKPSKADIAPAKMALGNTRGSHVSIRRGTGTLIITEGIEDALSLAQLTQGDKSAIWGCLSATQAESLVLPSNLRGKLLIALDNDLAGNRSADKLASRARAEGWRPERLMPPSGKDWNEYLLSKSK